MSKRGGLKPTDIKVGKIIIVYYAMNDMCPEDCRLFYITKLSLKATFVDMPMLTCTYMDEWGDDSCQTDVHALCGRISRVWDNSYLDNDDIVALIGEESLFEFALTNDQSKLFKELAVAMDMVPHNYDED